MNCATSNDNNNEMRTFSHKSLARQMANKNANKHMCTNKNTTKTIYRHPCDQCADVQHAVRFTALAVARLLGACYSLRSAVCKCVCMCSSSWLTASWVSQQFSKTLLAQLGVSRMRVASTNSLELTVFAFSILLYFCLYFIFATCHFKCHKW